MKSRRIARSLIDPALLLLSRLAALVAGLIVVGMVGFLVLEAAAALRAVGPGRFFTDPQWHPAEGLFGLLPMLAGTALATLGALLLATPLGIASALFCRYFAPRGIASLYRRLVELLAGTPSVVFGLWGLVVLVPLLNRVHPPGASLLAAILILALMVLPTLALTVESGLRSLPEEYLHAAAALGLSRWTTVFRVALPAARSAVATGILLATGRALGETMAVLMVCGNVVQLPRTLFDPIRTLTANVALEMAYALGLHRSALFLSGLLLALVVIGVVLIAEFAAREPTHA
jgi:phosphate transport system permease protein